MQGLRLVNIIASGDQTTAAQMLLKRRLSTLTCVSLPSVRKEDKTPDGEDLALLAPVPTHRRNGSAAVHEDISTGLRPALRRPQDDRTRRLGGLPLNGALVSARDGCAASRQ